MSLSTSPQTKLRYVPSALLGAYLLALGCGLAALTNWFRYTPSLEAMFVMRSALLPTLLVVTVYVVGQRMKSRVLPTALILIGVTVSVVAILAAVREAYGVFSVSSIDHVERNRDQVLKVDNRTLTYHLELINPYSEGRSVLVVGEHETERRFEIPLFEGGVAAFVPADEPGDWIQLYATQGPTLFELRTTSFLREARFEIDMASGTAREVEASSD